MKIKSAPCDVTVTVLVEMPLTSSWFVQQVMQMHHQIKCRKSQFRLFHKMSP